MGGGAKNNLGGGNLPPLAHHNHFVPKVILSNSLA
jgi:hypothetical protein